MIHTGTSVFSSARNKYADPIHCDDIGVDFPDLTVILAHGGRPLWMETAFFLVRRFPKHAEAIAFGVLLVGAGEVQIDNLRFDRVGEETAESAGEESEIPSKPSNVSFEE